MAHQLWVFGSNGEGQLGEGIAAADIVDKPTRLPNQSFFKDIKSVRSGDNHTLFLLDDGSVIGVGDNRVAQLSATSDAPSQINEFKKLQSSSHLCTATSTTSAFISTNGEHCSSIFTQGQGRWGELGCETVESTSIDTLPRIEICLNGQPIDFAAGVWHCVVVMASGEVYGWGKARLGQLGVQSHEKVNAPTLIEGLSFKPIRVVCGKDFTYLVGDPNTGEHIVLGKDKFNIISGMPADIKGYEDIGATWHAIFVLFDDGRLAAWGKENQWKLLPPNLPLVERIAVGTDHILAVTREGKLISWGWAKHGNCGDFTNLRHEMKHDMISGFWNEIDIPGKITKIAAGYCTSFVIAEVENEEGH
ncbi:regulator of chromosome condensation 1/beta-lactamase-inhibitor protein II [Boeremia exigua]|uniref:regulator of chromosome condensation 1/beta-lactamase-inhibitor protein II n=1 Tax=Boeremia exigua TaxID=749465 RepID=UPI001E8E8542|nr:regulator of chromosome condensation 1/beta-lactamase-inhibitor protein II [Boeremia exigua]KAH6616268.1 regulator of chromosome condensation 1/beta-lactamase-inhibitor protein II [Boeremia exigua]